MTEGFDVHIHGGTVVPTVRDLEWFRGDLLIRDGRIAAVTRGPAKDVSAAHKLDAGDALVLPGGDPASRLVFGASSADVRHVLVDGRPLVVAHELRLVDVPALRERVHEAWQATRARMEESP